MTKGDSKLETKRQGTRWMLGVVLGAVLAATGCGDGGEGAPGRPRDVVDASVAFDRRELAALRGSGKEISDAGPSVDTGVNIPDSRAALLDETLCKQACDHLFAMLLEERRERAKTEPDAAPIEEFEAALEEARPRKARTCIDECRRYASLRAVRCVTAAKSREALEACDF